MAYYPRYEAIFSNDLQQEVAVQILRKDIEEEIEQFTVGDLEINDSSDEGTIIARELSLGIFTDNPEFTWETLIADSYDEWMITVTVDGMYFFRGFIVPEEGEGPFFDQPYDVTVRATNGIKLLKDVPLTKLDGSTFKGKFTLLEYLTAALQKTLLEVGGEPLPIRIYGSWYNASMTDRLDNIAATYWNQVKHDHRTYMNDAVLFEKCYQVLLILLERHSRIFYWNDKWVIFLLHEHQHKPGGLYYTDFTGLGVLIGGAEDTEGPATVGQQEMIYPIDEGVLQNTSFPIKFAKTSYMYEPWEELPLNNKFERGTFIGGGTDADGNPYQDFTIDDWTPAMVDLFDSPPNWALDTVEGDIFLRRTFNIYGIELKREIFMETPTTASPGGDYVKWLISESIPVNLGDQIELGISLRFDNDFSGGGNTFSIIGRVILVPDVGTDYYALNNNQGGLETSKGRWILESGTPPDFISVDIPQDSDSSKLKNITIRADTIPVNGTVYVALQHSNDGTNAGGNKWFSGFEFTYIPFVAGGYIPVVGDYFQNTSSLNQLDTNDEEVRNSDTIIRVLRGCMFNVDGVTATNPTWYRLGVTESRHFKELINIAQYNFGYRRFYRLEGPFTSLTYQPVNNLLAIQPIGYHKTYRFVTLKDGIQEFILMPQLRMNLCDGNIEAVFEEVLNPALTTNYGADLDRVINGLIAATPVFYPGATLERVPPDPTLLKLTSTAGDVISTSVDDGGAGNFPSLTVNTQFDDGGVHITYLTIGTDIAIGNEFVIVVAPGGTNDILYTVVDIIEQSDGTQPGISSGLKYIFSNNRR